MVEAWLYGSAARGDADELSDVDVLVVAEPAERPDVSSLKIPSTASLSRYTWPEIDSMIEYGSLFLHHVKREGRPLLEEDPPRLRRLLDQLPAYARANQELDSFRQVVADVEASAKMDHSPQFEFAVLGTAARHAAILGCYFLGTPEFGRRKPFRVLLPQLGYDEHEIAGFERLYDYRVSENRGEVAYVRAEDTVAAWVSRVRALIAKVKVLER